ncbi:MAG TPA: peptidylprolyl isomerase [Steroidobacteraceae bacterium]|nr:peptidylprolyl isomerase [Steroidobacteraceae bacterium]
MKIEKLLPLVAACALAACAKTGTPAQTSASAGNAAATTAANPADKPVATVNGTPITRDMFEYFVKSTANKPSSQLTADQRNEALDNLIRGELVAQQAEKDGLGKSADVASELQLSHLEILEQAGAEHYLADKKPTDAELKSEYDQQVAAIPKTQYHARHILVTTQAQAQKIIAQLKRGAKFEDLAKKDSIDSSKDQGGDLGWFSPASMVKPFADAVATLKKGEITPAPVQTQYGWHVIQLLDTRETPVPPLDQVKDRVSQLVESKKFHAYEDQLMKTAQIQKNL